MFETQNMSDISSLKIYPYSKILNYNYKIYFNVNLQLHFNNRYTILEIYFSLLIFNALLYNKLFQMRIYFVLM